MATNRCSQCGKQFRTLADECGDHPCPRCGLEPGFDVDVESDDRDYATELLAYAEILDDLGVVPAGLADLCREVAEELDHLEDQRAYWERRCEHWRSRVDHLRQGRV